MIDKSSRDGPSARLAQLSPLPWRANMSSSAASNHQGPVKAFKAELGKAKRYLTKQESKERRTRTRGAVPEVSSHPAVNPLWAIIHNLVESFNRDNGIGTSIYEAKGGICPCLIQPHPD